MLLNMKKPPSSLSPAPSLSSLSSLPPPRRCRVVVVVVVAADWWWWWLLQLIALLFPCSRSVQISSPFSLVSRSGSRSRLRWSVLNPIFSHDPVYSFMLELGLSNTCLRARKYVKRLEMVSICYLCSCVYQAFCSLWLGETCSCFHQVSYTCSGFTSQTLSIYPSPSSTHLVSSSSHLTSFVSQALESFISHSVSQIQFLKHLETPKLLGITTPDKVRSKMIYASSNDRFKRELDGIQVDNPRHFSCCSFLGGE
ncbi:BnaC06g01640D [Brassica napus]|uniref:BnaC06g01640D protein n=1 Tax=Brassica napus TaxID=3708 RepID=A0A078I123_BRANA|nr:BnaC06g01640D [Brassica napus]